MKSLLILGSGIPDFGILSDEPVPLMRLPASANTLS